MCSLHKRSLKPAWSTSRRWRCVCNDVDKSCRLIFSRENGRSQDVGVYTRAIISAARRLARQTRHCQAEIDASSLVAGTCFPGHNTPAVFRRAGGGIRIVPSDSSDFKRGSPRHPRGPDTIVASASDRRKTITNVIIIRGAGRGRGNDKAAPCPY